MKITPEKVQLMLDGITQGKWKNYNEDDGSIATMGTHEICVINAMEINTPANESHHNAALIAASPDIAREYLKLHKENKRLRDALEPFAAVGNLPNVIRHPDSFLWSFEDNSAETIRISAKNVIAAATALKERV